VKMGFFDSVMAALGDGGGDLTPVAASAGAGVGTVIMVLLWAIILFLGVWFVVYWTSFKHTVIIREMTNTRKFIVSDKARIVYDKKDNVEYWQLRKRRVRLVSPTPESIEITKKGRFYAEVYHDLESGKDAGYNWIIDNNTPEFISYPAEHRALLSARFRRAAERRGKSTLEMVMTIAAIGIPLIALVLVFAFWGDLTKTTTEASRQLSSAMSEFTSKMTNLTCSQSLTAQPLDYSSSIPLDQQVRGAGG